MVFAGRLPVNMQPTEFDADQPWNRQPFDTEARWRGFRAYRDQPPPRSIRGASEALGDHEVRTLERWSAENAWPERVFEFDRHIDAARVAATMTLLEEDARVTAAFHIGLLRDAQTAAASVVKAWLSKLASGEGLEGWSPNDVRGMIKDCMSLERLVRGQATERVEVGIGVDLSRLTMGEIETMRLLEAKAGVVD